MSSTRYLIQEAKSGRSSCKKCKTKIEKGTRRIGTVVPNGDIEMTSWRCVGCFTLPRNFMSGLSAEDKEDAVTIFVTDELEDADGILHESTKQDIIKAIEAAKNTKRTKKVSKDSGAAADTDDVHTKMGTLKRLFNQQKDDDHHDHDKKSSNKKIKLESTHVKKELKIYSKYASMKNDDLKDILGWNKQLKGGNKDDMLARIVDGVINGRLGVCPLCTQGRIKLRSAKDDKVECNGYFDEDVQASISCSYTASPEDAPRLQPWYSEQPTEEQVAEMEKQFEQARGHGATQTKESASAEEDMIKKVKKIQWKTETKDDLKAMTKALVIICENNLDLPENKTRAIGPIVVRNKNLSAEQIFQEIVKQFGFATDKKAVAAKKEAALEASLKVPQNAPVIAALAELGQLYFKAGNRHGGVALNKVTNALKELDYIITEDNALKLGKGKTKIPGVGASSAKKIHEFLSTGTMERLEELRAEVE